MMLPKKKKKQLQKYDILKRTWSLFIDGNAKRFCQLYSIKLNDYNK